MARAGDELVNPATGLRTLFRRTAAEPMVSCSRSIGSPRRAGPRDRTTSTAFRPSASRWSRAG